MYSKLQGGIEMMKTKAETLKILRGEGYTIVDISNNKEELQKLIGDNCLVERGYEVTIEEIHDYFVAHVVN